MTAALGGWHVRLALLDLETTTSRIRRDLMAKDGPERVGTAPRVNRTRWVAARGRPCVASAENVRRRRRRWGRKQHERRVVCTVTKASVRLAARERVASGGGQEGIAGTVTAQRRPTPSAQSESTSQPWGQLDHQSTAL